MIVQCRFEGHLFGFDGDEFEAAVDTVAQFLTDRGLDNLAVSATLATGALEVEFTVAAEELRQGQEEAWTLFGAAIGETGGSMRTEHQAVRELAVA